jgi:AcrR family transcriptional regulator
MIDTKDRIILAAEELFAEKGFAATSLRAITQKADVNLASVNYHFGGKEALVRHVLMRKSEPLNQRRMAYLEQFRKEGKTALEDILYAFIAPALEMTKEAEGERYIKLLARVAIEPVGEVASELPKQYTEVLDQFVPAMIEHVPVLPAEELFWRIHFLLGTLGYCMAGQDAMLLSASKRLCNPDDIDAMIHRLVTFVAAGMRADVPAHIKQLAEAS